MIVAEQKPIEEIRGLPAGHKRVLALGGGTCGTSVPRMGTAISRASRQFLASVCILSLLVFTLNAATYTMALTITPASPVTNWSVMLWPGESAELTIKVAEKGNMDLDEYTLDGPPTVTFTLTNPAFAWTREGSTFSIVHTATSPAVAVVEVACSWSGGSGEIDGGVIPGLATGTARAEVVEIDKVQYRLGSSNAWADIPLPLLVAKGTTVEFRAIPRPTDAEWPLGKPAWSGATGSDAQASWTFDTAGSFWISAECWNVVSGNVVVVEVTIENSPQMVYDGQTTDVYFQCLVTPAGVSTLFFWTAFWTAPYYHNPSVDFTLPTASITRIRNARWYATSEATCFNQPALYKVNCAVATVGGVFTSSVPVDFYVCLYGKAGRCDPPWYEGNVEYDVAQTNGRYVVVGVADPWRRTAAVPVIYYATNSQFYGKTLAHELQHKTDFDEGFDGHVFVQREEFLPMVLGLSSPTIDGLATILQSKFDEYMSAEAQEIASVLSDLERRAYTSSDIIPPYYVYQSECGGL